MARTGLLALYGPKVPSADQTAWISTCRWPEPEPLDDCAAYTRLTADHVERLQAIAEPPSLVEVRRQVNAMLPRVDLPEVILEVMNWEPRFVEAFTAASGGRTRLGDLHVSVAACLTAHALNIG